MLSAGIHSNIPPAHYHADPAPTPSLSSSIAKVLLFQSPEHAWLQHPRLNPEFRDDGSSRLDIGSAAHDHLLEGGTPRIKVLDPEDYPNKTGGGVPTGWTNAAIRAARDEARAKNLIPVLKSDWKQIADMAEVAHKFIRGSELEGCFDKGWGESEVTLVWEEPMVSGPIWCRARPDRMREDRRLILDYKTTTDANPEYLTRAVICQLGYDMQAGFYDRGVDVLTGTDPDFVFLFQEIDAPYACSLVGLEPALIEVGRNKVAESMRRWAKCMSTGKWPTYSNQIHFAQAPAWALADGERYA